MTTPPPGLSSCHVVSDLNAVQRLASFSLQLFSTEGLSFYFYAIKPMACNRQTSVSSALAGISTGHWHADVPTCFFDSQATHAIFAPILEWGGQLS